MWWLIISGAANIYLAWRIFRLDSRVKMLESDPTITTEIHSRIKKLTTKIEELEAKHDRLYGETRVYFVQPVLALRDPRPTDGATWGKVWLNMRLRSSWTYQGEDGKGSHIWRQETWMA